MEIIDGRQYKDNQRKLCSFLFRGTYYNADATSLKGLYISQPPPQCVEGRVGYPFVMLSTFSVTLSQDPALPLGTPAKYVE